MKRNLTLLLAAFLMLGTTAAFAQTDDEDTSESVTLTAVTDNVVEYKESPRKGYFAIMSELSLFQSAAAERPGANRELTYLRFTFGVNFGFHYNYDFDEHFSAFIGLSIRNVGFTDKIGDLTIKRRVYNLGVPVGFRVGNLGRKNYALIGGGIDVPFNYREKSWTDRKHKTKSSEWFSDRTPEIMPYLFAGIGIKSGLVVRFNFYPSNFFNTSYEETTAGVTRRPYTGYDARLLTLSLGYNMAFSRGSR